MERDYASIQWTHQPKRKSSHEGEYKTTILVTPMKTCQMHPPQSFDLTQENASSPIQDAQQRNSNSSPCSPLQRSTSRPASPNKNSIETEPRISTPSWNSTEKWTLQTRNASTSLRQMAKDTQTATKSWPDSILTSNESSALLTLKELTSTYVRMANALSNLQEKQTSIAFLRTFAKSIETASAGFHTVEVALNQLQTGLLQDLEEQVSVIQNMRESNGTCGYTDLPMPAKPNGSKKTSTVTVTTRSATRGIPSITTPMNRSLSTMTSRQQLGTYSSSEMSPRTPGPAQATPVTTYDTSQEDSPSGQWYASTSRSPKNLGMKLRKCKTQSLQDS